MRFGVVVFPGTWSDCDFHYVISEVLHQPVKYVWHRERDLARPRLRDPARRLLLRRLSAGGRGGRPLAGRRGVAATSSPGGGLVLGSCNGFQILCEAGLLPGALMRNECLQYRCQSTHLLVENVETPFTRALRPGQVLTMPISHGEGKYHADPEHAGAAARSSNQVVFRYATAGRPGHAGRESQRLGREHRGHRERGGNGARHDAASRARGRDGHGRYRRPARSSSRSSAASSRTARFLKRRYAHRRVRAGSGEPKVTLDLARGLGLTADEYDRIVDAARARAHLHRARPLLGAVVRALRVQALAGLPRGCPRPARACCRGPGENAGAIDIGDGWAVVFKMESHNHPSFIEPFQGAATGRGRHPARHLHDGRAADRDPRLAALRRSRRSARRGTSSRASCRGSAGTATASAARRSAARSPSRPSTPATRWSTSCASASCAPTGSSGRGPRASATRSSTSATRPGATASTARPWPRPRSTSTPRSGGPTVQVGDPFTEKLLLEACLEAMATGAVVGIQDMGAAGLACCTSEMPARSGTGMDVELSAVPAARGGHDALRDAALGVAGAHAPGRRARARGGGAARLRQVGARRGARSAR